MGDAGAFGELLRRHRLAAGLTQEALAERAGLSLRGLSDLERGARRAPYRHTTLRLAEALALGEMERATLLASGGRQWPIGSPSRKPPQARVPRPLSSFIGRERDIEEVASLLETNRLVTLTGTGGIGKTRLAIAVASGQSGPQATDTVLVELAPLTDTGLVPQAVASALHIGDQPGRSSMDTLLDALRPAQLLLVIDNCEHLIQACAELAETVLRECPDVRVLATSREPLRIAGEVIWRVPSLSLPAADASTSVENLAQSEAVRLFVQRAAQGRPGFRLREENSAAIAQVCRLLDGVPLAIELAAARIPALAVNEISARLDHCFQLLTSGSRTASPRHQTLRGTLDWSYGLLTEPERTLLSRVSVFAGGWTLQAIEAVCAGGVVELARIVDLLAGLVDKSMVVADETPGGVRYRLLETIRQYAAEKLRESGEKRSARSRHLSWHLELAGQSDLALVGPDQEDWLRRLPPELDNFRAALAWSRSEPNERQSGLSLATGLMRFWRYAGHPNEGCAWLTMLATPDMPPVTRARALAAAAYVRDHQGDHAAAWPLATEALALARRLTDASLLAQVLCTLGRLRLHAGRPGEAVAPLEEAVALAEGAWKTYALLNLGFVTQALGQSDQALSYYQDALSLARAQQDRFGTAVLLRALGGLLLDLGQLATARQHLEEALELSRGIPTSPNVAPTLALLAGLAVAAREPRRAFKLAGAAIRLKAAVEARLLPTDLAGLERRLESARNALDPATVEALSREGAALSQADAIDYALAGDDARDHAPLTEREWQVALLLAQSLSNQAVAVRLVISEGTAKRHVENILAKLQLRSRAQVADWISHRTPDLERCAALGRPRCADGT